MFIRSVFGVFVEQRRKEEEEGAELLVEAELESELEAEAGGASGEGTGAGTGSGTGTKHRATGPSDSIVNETGRRIV